MANKTEWSMNETQKSFVEALEAHAEGATLLDLKLEGKEFKTGSINTLVAKGIVTADAEKSYDCEIVYNGVTVGRVTKKGKIYRLVRKD